MKGLFVTGTDTGVGKTTVTCAIARALVRRGRRVGVMKPFESGCARRADGSLVPADATALLAASGSGDPLDLVCPFRFEAPLAPGVAAAREGVAIDLAKMDDALASIAQGRDVVLVEGAGGLLVPLTPDAMVPEIAVRVGLPLLVVARAGLGTVNHSLLTLEAARARGLEVRAVVLNRVTGEDDDPSIEDNAEVIARLGDVRVIGPLPFAPHPETGDDPLAHALDPVLDALL